MHAGTLSIAELYTSLAKATNTEAAEVISRAFEQTALDQKQQLAQTYTPWISSFGEAHDPEADAVYR